MRTCYHVYIACSNELISVHRARRSAFKSATRTACRFRGAVAKVRKFSVRRSTGALVGRGVLVGKVVRA